jgi:hypothetical protein
LCFSRFEVIAASASVQWSRKLLRVVRALLGPPAAWSSTKTGRSFVLFVVRAAADPVGGHPDVATDERRAAQQAH